MVVCSPRVKNYLDLLESRTLKEYEVAQISRKKGFDPEDYVDIPLAVDVADRCEGIYHSKNHTTSFVRCGRERHRQA